MFVEQNDAMFLFVSWAKKYAKLPENFDQY